VFARETGNVFRAPKRTLGDLDAESAAELIAAAADIALIVDAKGIVRDVSLGDEELARSTTRLKAVSTYPCATRCLAWAIAAA
jgi:hypothetical protein